MEIFLPSVPLYEIFSYLDAFSLLQAAQVNKSWHEVTGSDILWRKLCLKRWPCCDVPLEFLNAQTWKQFFLRQTRQEHSMTRAKPEDFIYKEIPGDFGLGNVNYLSGSGLTREGQGKSVVCVVISLTCLSTWDLREGVMTWVSPAQSAKIERVATLPEMHFAITVDMKATIKVWNCRDRDALATNAMFTSCGSLEAVLTKDGPFVLAGDVFGNLYIFRIPDLQLISRVPALKYTIDHLHCSPQKEWVFLNKKHPHISPKVFLMNSLLRPSEYPTPVFATITPTLCDGAFWTPRREDRITLMFQRGPCRASGFTTYDIKMEKNKNKIDIRVHKVAAFQLPYYIESLGWMGVSDKNAIVFSSKSSLFVYNMQGIQLQRFEGCCLQRTMKLLVDPVHVISTFTDGSLDVYTWEERRPYLRKCYHLQNETHVEPPSIISKAQCDNVSIARVVETGSGCSFLSAYILKVCS